MNRRGFVMTGAAVGCSMLGRSFADPSGEAKSTQLLGLGKPRAFSFEALRRQARDLSQQTFDASKPPAADLVQQIDFDVVQKIRPDANCALRFDGGLSEVRFFHLDKYNQWPVRIHRVQQGQAREVLYSPACFKYPDAAWMKRLPNDLGFSGFRVMGRRPGDTDWLAFQGASYFRSCGPNNQYGLSARGIAVNSVMSVEEEFPRFTQFWLEDVPGRHESIVVHALLEGPSITGAFRMHATRGQPITVDVQSELFVRADIQRLGIAPLTSMYWYGENQRNRATDWRPEVHDSDGLALWRGNDEHIWRPLINPDTLQTNAYLDERPKGFGLMQRDHDFDHYQDDGAFYERRPSLWVEPRGNWGEGSVQLAEIPTSDETHDNIVAFWVPKDPVKKGAHFQIDYRLYWVTDEPHWPHSLARVVATRIGRGGIPGRPLLEDASKMRFAIDFSGGPLTAMKARFDIQPVVSAGSATVSNAYVVRVVGTDRWRAVFDVNLGATPPDTLRCYLRLGDLTLSETWLYPVQAALNKTAGGKAS